MADLISSTAYGKRIIYASRTGYKGVCQNGQRGYKAQITSAGRSKNLGSFLMAEEAAICYDKQAIVENKKELNFPDMRDKHVDLPLPLAEHVPKKRKRRDSNNDSDVVDDDEISEEQRQKETTRQRMIRKNEEEKKILKEQLTQKHAAQQQVLLTKFESVQQQVQQQQQMVDHSDISNTVFCDSCNTTCINTKYYISTVQMDYDLCISCWLNCSNPSDYTIHTPVPMVYKKIKRKKYKNKSGCKIKIFYCCFFFNLCFY